jgi:hypothetical protein
MSDIQRLYSPNKRFFVLLSCDEIRMSHWITSAALWEATPERVLLLLGNAWWSAEQLVWRDDSTCVTAELRRYPGDVPAILIDIYPEQRSIMPNTPAGTAPIPFEGLDQYLEGYYQKHTRTSPASTKRT